MQCVLCIFSSSEAKTTWVPSLPINACFLSLTTEAIFQELQRTSLGSFCSGVSKLYFLAFTLGSRGADVPAMAGSTAHPRASEKGARLSERNTPFKTHLEAACNKSSWQKDCECPRWGWKYSCLGDLPQWNPDFYYQVIPYLIIVYLHDHLIFRVNQLEVLQSPTTSSLHCLNVMCLSRIDVTRLFNILCWPILFAAYFHQAIAESGSALSGWAFDSKPEQHGKVICWSLFLFYFLISYWKDLTSLKRNSSLPQPTFSLYEHYCFLISLSPLDSHVPQDLLFTECFKTHWLSNWWYEQAGHLPQGSNMFLLLLFNFNTVWL